VPRMRRTRPRVRVYEPQWAVPGLSGDAAGRGRPVAREAPVMTRLPCSGPTPMRDLVPTRPGRSVVGRRGDASQDSARGKGAPTPGRRAGLPGDGAAARRPEAALEGVEKVLTTSQHSRLTAGNPDSSQPEHGDEICAGGASETIRFDPAWRRCTARSTTVAISATPSPRPLRPSSCASTARPCTRKRRAPTPSHAPKPDPSGIRRAIA
jgi:hypothetical protein